MKVSGGATWVWWCIMIMMMMMMMMGVTPSLATEEEVESEVRNNQVPFTTITYNFNSGKAGYTAFLTSFRNALAAKVEVCGIQATLKTPPLPYIHVQLNSSDRKSITVGIATPDIYVTGYKDNGLNRARFFKEIKDNDMSKIFPGQGVTRTRTKVSENYNSMVPDTRFDRTNISLRVTTLEMVFKEVYGKSVSVIEKKDKKLGQPESNFFFIVCQMIAEATRFKFMGNLIVSPAGTNNSSTELMDLQSNWNKISKAIHEASPQCQKLKSDLVIGKNTYKTVAEIKEKMGILHYLK